MRFLGTPSYGRMTYRETSRIRGQEQPEQSTRCNPMSQRSGASRFSDEVLLLEIQRLSFVETELRLYLDAYPECQSALRYYREIVAKLKGATDAYETKYGPLTATSTRGEPWLWTVGKWPWQTEEWR